ncbi:hypothetical protein DPMN_168952 [Dreissena polymorpha]|uniref:Uncharacterized protein n=1 Tax=Dreissena polymorpha TaxID=45954 RepID=A0A9D4IXR5_DREPO|nr:hypothetical protein DPMN_168952 [Dreissena polymorpha]
MATEKEKITEDDTKCSICLLIFRKPRILTCKHKFCHDCLCGIVKQHEGKSAFPCPLCRASINTDIRITIETSGVLVTQFPVDLEMQSHLDRRKTCVACKIENKNEIATVYCMGCHEHMCKSCGENHIKYKNMRNHQLRPSEEAPSPKVANSLQELSRCPNHETEHLEYICQDHDQPCCSKCTLTSHRKCDKVDLLRDVIKDSKTYEASIKEKTDMMDKALKHVSALCLELEGEPLRIATYEKNIELQLSEIKSLIENAVQSLKGKVRKAFMKDKKDIKQSSETTLRKATAKKSDIQNKKEELDGVLSHGDDVQKYVYMRNQPSNVDAEAAMYITFTQKRIVLEKTPECSSQNYYSENSEPRKSSRFSPTLGAKRFTGKQTLLNNVLREIENLVEVKQICVLDAVPEPERPMSPYMK